MYEYRITTSKKEKYKNNLRLERIHKAFIHGLNPYNRDFICACCHLPVSADPLVAAVGNRNHCPYCLASRHMDWREPGDRLSACKEVMHPVALTFKRKHKKYSRGVGELLVVHRCVGCGRISANRIAADDDPDKLWFLFEQSIGLDEPSHRRIESTGIHPVTNEDRQNIQDQLYGIELEKTL